MLIVKEKMVERSWMLELLLAVSVPGILFDIHMKAYGVEQLGNHVVQRREGDITIGGLVHVAETGGSGEDGNQIVEAINMVVNKINKCDKILPGIILGTMILDTMWNATYTFKQIIYEFFPQLSAETKTCEAKEGNETKALFAGIIGTSTSDTSIDSAKLLQAFSIPQISYWATNPTLSDKEKFPYFFRTIPPDTHMVKAIVDFVAQQRWNYISVVYENTHYGSMAYSVFEETADDKDICVAVECRIPNDPTDQDCKEVIRELIGQPSAQAVLIILWHTAAKCVLKAAANSKASDKFIWIATDAWTRLLPEMEDDVKEYETELDGTVGFAPKADPVLEFNGYFTQITLGERRKSDLNPWFAEFVSKQKNCTLPESAPVAGIRTCDDDERVVKETFEQFPYVENVANAVLLFAYSLNEVHKELCGGKPKLCDAMKKMAGTNKLAMETYEVMKGVIITGINGDTFAFDRHQDAPFDYYIYNYKSELVVPSGKEKKKWEKVANINSEGVEWLTNLSEKVQSSKSYCSEECNSNEFKKIGAVLKKCCWACHHCEDMQYVANGTECTDCEQGTRPNNESTGCDKIPLEFMSHEKPHSIVSSVFGITGVLLTVLILAVYVKKRDCPIVKASGRVYYQHNL